uniref:Uncharacterized protein n=1 Tax=Arundo donax TaxID=35708 RepID=A0A0A8XX12_ARUDO
MDPTLRIFRDISQLVCLFLPSYVFLSLVSACFCLVMCS